MVDIDKKNPWLGYLPLVALIVVAFVIVNPYLFQNSLDSSSPNSYLASDAYYHLAYILDVIEVGNYNYESSFYTGYSEEKVSPVEPPLVFFYVAFLSNLLSIPSHVAALFGLFLGIILTISTIYVILKKYSLTWAIGFLPVTLFLFTHPFSALITWGFWKACTMYFIFVTSIVLFASKLDWKKAVLLVIFASSLILASPALLPYFLILFALKLILEWSEIKKNGYIFAVSGITTLIITIHYFLNYSLARTHAGENKIMDALGFQKGYHLFGANAYTSHFGIWWYVALVGFVYALVYLFQNYNRRETYAFKVFLLFSLFFLVFLLPSIGITRIYQFRLLWPLFVAVLVGLAVYLGLTFAKKVKPFPIELGAIIVSTILIIGMFSYLPFSKTSQAITSTEQWDAYMYMHYQTPKTSTLLIVDPTPNQIGVKFSADRRLYFYSSDEFIKADQEQKMLINTIPTFNCVIPERSRKGLNIYANDKLIKWCEDMKQKLHPICFYNYLYINKQFSSQAQVSLMQDFINSINMSHFDKVKDGSQVLLLKNNHVCENQDVQL